MFVIPDFGLLGFVVLLCITIAFVKLIKAIIRDYDDQGH